MLAPVDLVMIYVLEPGAGVLTSSLSPVFKLGSGGIQVDFCLSMTARTSASLDGMLSWSFILRAVERSLRAS